MLRLSLNYGMEGGRVLRETVGVISAAVTRLEVPRTSLNAMMRINEHRNVIIILAASFAFFAQSDDFPVKSQDYSSVLDVRQIVESSITATQRHWQVRLHSTYMEREESRRRDLAGRVKSEEVDVSRTILVNGVPFEQLVEHNGQPLSVEEERKQKEKLEKLKRETPEQCAERLRKQEEENTLLVRELPKAFDFQLRGEEAVNGRPAYVLQATPHPGYQAQGKYGKMFSKVEGKFWVDKQDLGWINVDAQVIQPFSMGLFLVRLLRGSEIKMEQTRVEDGIWMPRGASWRAFWSALIRHLLKREICSIADFLRPSHATR